MFGVAKGRIDEDGLTAAVFGLMHHLAATEAPTCQLRAARQGKVYYLSVMGL